MTGTGAGVTGLRRFAARSTAAPAGPALAGPGPTGPAQRVAGGPHAEPTAPAPRTPSCARCAARSSTDGTGTWSRSSSDRSSAPAAPAISSSSPRAPRAASTGRCPSGSVTTRHAAGRRGLERAADPGRDGLLLRQLRARPRGRGLSEPGGVTECELDLAAWDRLVAGYPLLAAMTPDVEAMLREPPEHGNEVFLLPIDECYALVGELRRALAGVRRRRRGARRAGGLPGRPARPRAPRARHPGSAEMADLVFGCTGASAERYAATPTLSFAVTITESTGVPRARDRLALPDPHRAAAAAVLRGRGEAAARPVRRHRRAGPTRSSRSSSRLVTTMVPAFSALTEIEVQMPCTYDLEVASARYLQALDDGTIPLLLLFSGTVFLAQGNGYSVELVPWSSEASYPDAGERLAGCGRPALPRQCVAALQPRDSRRPVRLQNRARPADLGRDARRAAGGGRGGQPTPGAPADRPRR